MQGLTYVVFINLAHYYGKDRARRAFRLCTSLVPRPMVALFGLGTRLHVRMRTKLENGVLRNGQQLQRAVNGMTSQVLKTLCIAGSVH